MKVLVSSIACHPTNGSECGVGWSAVCRIALSHDVYLITHRRNEHDWRAAKVAGVIPSNIHVRFIGSTRLWFENRLAARIQSWIDFWKFNSEILSIAESWHKEEKSCFTLMSIGW